MEQDLENDTNFIQIGRGVWKKGQSIECLGIKAVTTSKMHNFFGDDYPTMNIQGVVLGLSQDGKKILVQWSLPGNPVYS